MTRSKYETEVFRWGSGKPWKKGQRVSHKDKFGWSDVKTDGQGNVLEMPLLRGKPCFGRIEYFLRHGKMENPSMRIRGRVMVTKTRCGAPCPVRGACKNLCKERISSDRGVSVRLRDWLDQCRLQNRGERTFTGPVGRYWTAILSAISDRGPYYNVNDERLRELEAHARDVQVLKWRKDKKRQRERERNERAARHQPPSPEFIANAEAERDLRREILKARAGDPSLPPEIAKIRPQDAERTAEVTANAWLIAAIKRAMGYDVKPGTVARKMVEQGLSAGLAYGTLKARMKNDLARVRILEELGVWLPFDPEQDLLDVVYEDIEGADGSVESEEQTDNEAISDEMEEVLREMAKVG